MSQQDTPYNLPASSTATANTRVDYLIVGQGLCGTLLSWHLFKEGKTFVVIDEDRDNSASKVAAGIINPVTGRRYVNSWMIEELYPFAQQVYTEMGRHLQSQLILLKDLIDFFPSPQMRDAFVNRILENNTYLHSYPDQNEFNTNFNYDFGCGLIKPVFMVHLTRLLRGWRKYLKDHGCLFSERFEAAAVTVTDTGVHYRGCQAERIIFCEGIGAMENGWFRLLPFSAVKGEALIIRCAGLDSQHIYKKGLSLAPLEEEDNFWVGSNYQWTFEDDRPTEQFYAATVLHLKHWLKVPFKVLDHRAGIRPAAIERRPFVGFHPKQQRVGILNGMGTKGTSLAPFFAHHLVQHMLHGIPLQEEVDVNRFNRILSHS